MTHIRFTNCIYVPYTTRLPKGELERVKCFIDTCVGFVHFAGIIRQCTNASVLLHSGGRVCIITHGGTLRGIYERVVGLPSKTTVANAALSVIKVDGEFIDLSTWGEVRHLEGGDLMANSRHGRKHRWAANEQRVLWRAGAACL